MTEDQFAQHLVDKLQGKIDSHEVKVKQSLLYDLSFDHKGVIATGVDENGEPIRGGGRGFEQDILVYDKVTPVDTSTSVIPRIAIEVKFGAVTTHDAIVYSEKADRIRRVYPYVRYGFVLGGMSHIPGRVLRLGQRFDFIAALGEELDDEEVNKFIKLLRMEAKASMNLVQILFEKKKLSLFHKSLISE